ncbi:MAG TPA: serine hydrolase domain-containing protein [Vicinamibacterales bacterium]|nr:serine hydrolase domain-containing protein [Vicinamibacterales bacterium]HPW20269.1 serine hydrolase domain-containing protein [Vicinamibacterales bacterium]
MLLRAALLCGAVVLAVSLPPEARAPAAAQDEPRAVGEIGRALDEYLSRLERFGFAGGAAAVRGNQVVLLKSYGLADRARRVPLGTDSVFSIGSITKQFTAAAVLTLEMQGRLAVGDAIGKYLDGVPPDKTGMTLHHLLTHSSGLESDFSSSDYDPVGREEYVGRALASTLLFAPGRGYQYANAGYSLLAAIIERVSGEPYEAYLREHVLLPAGMRETGYKIPAWPPARIAHGYLDTGEDWGTLAERLEPAGAPYWTLRGNGGLQTTLPDMVAWHRALGTDAVLSKAARAKYFAPYVAEGPRGLSHYAYGWVVSKSARGTTVVRHNGGNGVYVAEFVRFPDEDAMLFLASTDAGWPATPAAEALERILFGGTAAMPPRAVSEPPERLAEYAGDWRLPRGSTLTLALDGASLLARPSAPEAFAALSAPDPALAERLADVSRRTAAITEKAFAGDVVLLHAAMGRSMPLEALRTREFEMMRDRERRLGPFRGSAVVGALPRGPNSARVFVRLDFETASVYNVYVWGPARIIGLRGSPEPPAFRYLPIGGGSFASFSFDGGGTVRSLRFVMRDGALRLLLGSGPAPAEAVKNQ